MFRRMLLFIFAVSLFGAAGVRAQGDLPPPPCIPKDWKELSGWRNWGDHSSRDNAARWSAESERRAGNPSVWRWLDRLYLEVDGGEVVTLADCPFTDGTYSFLYERYDRAGRFYVVRTQYYEDLIYALVMKRTGRLYNVPALPVWSPDETRFAYAACSGLNSRNDLAIMRPAGEEKLTIETESKIPCGLSDCEIGWESNEALSVTCPQSGEQFKERRVLRMGLSDGRWTSR
jgi:hypothetical protein